MDYLLGQLSLESDQAENIDQTLCEFMKWDRSLLKKHECKLGTLLYCDTPFTEQDERDAQHLETETDSSSSSSSLSTLSSQEKKIWSQRSSNVFANRLRERFTDSFPNEVRGIFGPVLFLQKKPADNSYFVDKISRETRMDIDALRQELLGRKPSPPPSVHELYTRHWVNENKEMLRDELADKKKPINWKHFLKDVRVKDSWEKLANKEHFEEEAKKTQQQFEQEIKEFNKSFPQMPKDPRKPFTYYSQQIQQKFASMDAKAKKPYEAKAYEACKNQRLKKKIPIDENEPFTLPKNELDRWMKIVFEKEQKTLWNQMNDNDKQPYEQKALEDKKRYEREFFQFQQRCKEIGKDIVPKKTKPTASGRKRKTPEKSSDKVGGGGGENGTKLVIKRPRTKKEKKPTTFDQNNDITMNLNSTKAGSS